MLKGGIPKTHIEEYIERGITKRLTGQGEADVEVAWST